jgi:hypothetical protein
MKHTIFALAVTLCLSLAANAQTGSIQGTLWVVSETTAANVTFPPPAAIPDATFTTNGIAYIGQEPGQDYEIGQFLGKGGTAVYGLTFSGLSNPNLPGGAAASGKIPMSGHNYGVIIEFTGTTNLTNGLPINILDDDGVALEIDGSPISGFDSSIRNASLQSVTFTGTTGLHSFDLLYANAVGGGAWLLFFPNLY